MKRRSLLKAVAAAAPAIAFPDFLLFQASAHDPAPPASPDVHIVGPNQDRFGKAHSLGFSTFYFKVTGAETAGRIFLMEHEQMIPGGPILHLHPQPGGSGSTLSRRGSLQDRRPAATSSRGRIRARPTQRSPHLLRRRPNSRSHAYRLLSPPAKWSSTSSTKATPTHPGAALDSMKSSTSARPLSGSPEANPPIRPHSSKRRQCPQPSGTPGDPQQPAPLRRSSPAETILPTRLHATV